MKENKLFLSSKIVNLKNYSLKKLSRRFDKAFFEIDKKFSNSQNFFNLFSKNYKFSFKSKELNKFKKFKKIALIGMGGSILGSMAIHNIFENKIRKKLYFFDDLNEKKLLNFKKRENLNKVLFLIISKSGNTIETLANTFSLEILKKNAKNVIIISEKKNNQLYALSKKLNLFFIEHKHFIGGRYSVLSEVGIIPAYLMGLDVNKLRSNITGVLKKNKMPLRENSIKLTNLLNSKQFNSLILLNYAPQLEKFLFWCQQLIAESLGKKFKGFLPVVSSAPRDHHSLLQLYLDGPKDKLFYIFSCDEQVKQKINIKKKFNSKSYLNKKSLSFIKNAQKNALIKSFNKYKIPFREFKIRKINEVILGELFSYFIFETIIVGKLAKINPFDQPAVEQVKIFTKNYLK
ncbi:MAG: glucose-6-phosphate isomerase [Candidatus Pelagibacter sp. TMED286]|nr:MAG: glucose-6-phosphate isomerase [Pelagibacterales bacterium MED-G43]RPG94745.1 MAG: glucose-6-phosphate isomerase [Candidatus Pelagibacter sp. TMED286]